MKFICNNCGFSAEIPEKRSNCPMCASNNVTVMEAGEEKKKSGITGAEKSDIPVPGTGGTEENREDARKEKITLTDNFFDQKPNKEEQEIADVLKELYPDEEKKGRGFKPDWRILAGVGAVVVIFLVVIVISMSSDNSEEAETADVEDIEEVEEKVKEIEEKELPKQVDERESVVAKVEKKEPEPEPEKKEVEEEPQKKAPAIQKNKKPIAKKRNPKPKKKKIAKKTPRPKKKVNVNQKYNEFIQLGHTALGQKKYTDALHEYKNAMRLKPRNGKIYKFIGIAYAYLQNQTQACKNYRKYIQLTPNAKDKAQVQAFLEACP